MKIDNDFLTLLDLTLRLHHLDRIEDELAGYDIEGVMPLMVKNWRTLWEAQRLGREDQRGRRR